MLVWRGAIFLSLMVVGGKGYFVTLGELEFQAGDSILTSYFNDCLHLVLPPYHALFAIQSDVLLQIGYLEDNEGKAGFMSFKSELEVPMNLEGLKGFVVSPRPRKVFIGERFKTPWIIVSPIGRAGLELAKRLVNNQGILPYDMQRCNCRHYSDYLTYGVTFGKEHNPGYLPLSDDCPLHYRITKDTDTTAPDFALRDKNMNAYPLQ